MTCYLKVVVPRKYFFLGKALPTLLTYKYITESFSKSFLLPTFVIADRSDSRS